MSLAEELLADLEDDEEEAEEEAGAEEGGHADDGEGQGEDMDVGQADVKTSEMDVQGYYRDCSQLPFDFSFFQN